MNDHARTAAWLALLLLGISLSAIQFGGDDPHLAPVHAGQGHGHDHGEQHRPRRLFSWEPEQAHTLTLYGADEEKRVFTRAGDGWKTRQASNQNAFDPQAYLALLSQARKDREFAADTETLNSFGLAPALLRVLVQDKTGATLADLTVGSLTPDGFGRYVLSATGTNILIIPNYQFQAAM